MEHKMRETNVKRESPETERGREQSSRGMRQYVRDGGHEPPHTPHNPYAERDPASWAMRGVGRELLRHPNTVFLLSGCGSEVDSFEDILERKRNHSLSQKLEIGQSPPELIRVLKYNILCGLLYRFGFWQSRPYQNLLGSRGLPRSALPFRPY